MVVDTSDYRATHPPTQPPLLPRRTALLFVCCFALLCRNGIIVRVLGAHHHHPADVSITRGSSPDAAGGEPSNLRFGRLLETVDPDNDDDAQSRTSNLSSINEVGQNEKEQSGGTISTGKQMPMGDDDDDDDAGSIAKAQSTNIEGMVQSSADTKLPVDRGAVFVAKNQASTNNDPGSDEITENASNVELIGNQTGEIGEDSKNVSEKSQAKSAVWPDDDDDDDDSQTAKASVVEGGETLSSPQESVVKEKPPLIPSDDDDDIQAPKANVVEGAETEKSVVKEKAVTIPSDDDDFQAAKKNGSIDVSTEQSAHISEMENVGKEPYQVAASSPEEGETTGKRMPLDDDDVQNEETLQTETKILDDEEKYDLGDESNEDKSSTYEWESTNSIGGGDNSPIGGPNDFFTEEDEASIGYHRNESSQEEMGGRSDETNKGGIQKNSAEEEAEEGNTPNNVPPELDTSSEMNNEIPGGNAADGDVSGDNSNPVKENVGANPTTSICSQAMNCGDCLDRSILHLQQNIDGPCYWLQEIGAMKCITHEEAINVVNATSGAYMCGDNGAAVYTGEGWQTALDAIAGVQTPASGEGNEVTIPGTDQQTSHEALHPNYDYDDDEEDGLFDLLKTTVNYTLLTAFLASVFMIRKNALSRLRSDPSLNPATTVKEEVVSFVTMVASMVMNVVSGAGASRSGSGNSAVRASSFGRAGSNSYERESVPLSTAADEEWGWDDDDAGTNFELSGIGDGGDESKEEDDLAMAIAMSLSESTNDSTGTRPTQSIPSKKPQTPTVTPKKVAPPKPRSLSSAKPPLPKAPVASPEPPTSSSGGGDSIEALLGQMKGGGGPVITAFGQTPQVPKATAKRVPKKEDNDDDIFASMGLSSFPSKPAAVPATSASRPPLSGGWQASTITQTAPKSAPLPSRELVADALDDDLDADWGDDDDDLDDLLDE
ncbi:predicted protein [Thalassiosira pseudonana CCMP1335]|uniref:Uncharacterized protein n=1 Tax=Thalassiosira pseudonana TaxID=35128 RepID=B8BTY2_THAPS|nr:predicted protein [Thalassiosira pseudonana CCMP1335]EED95182.1 predicted protein [Thalassiosira pseudonana CCMP1335]